METIFAELKMNTSKPAERERRNNKWISEETWRLIDQRAGMRQKGELVQALSRRIGRQIKNALKKDRIKRAEKVASEVEGFLSAGELQEAWRAIKGWYRTAEERPPTPCHETMARQTDKREKLYTRQQPAGEPIPINVEPTEVRDDKPGDDEIRAAVRKLSRGRAGGASKMRAEDLKEWLQGIIQEENTGTE